jgi:hypothetical protein
MVFQHLPDRRPIERRQQQRAEREEGFDVVKDFRRHGRDPLLVLYAINELARATVPSFEIKIPFSSRHAEVHRAAVPRSTHGAHVILRGPAVPGTSG